MTINPYDLTILIQGPFECEAKIYSLVDRIRSVFEVNIVVSTWGSKQLVKLYNDALIVYSIDPGPDKCVGEKWGLNFNRQCVSVINGLRHVETAYAAKLRSDCYFVNDNLLKLFDQFIASGKSLMLSSKVVRQPYPYYSSDWFMLANTNVLRSLWTRAKNIGVQNNYYEKCPLSILDYNQHYYARYHPEQVIYLSQFCNESFERFGSGFFGFSKSFIKNESENFCVGRYQLGLRSNKYPNTIFDFFPLCAGGMLFMNFRIFISFLIGLGRYLSKLFSEKAIDKN